MVNDRWLASQHMVVQVLWFLVDLAVAATTEEGHPKMLPCVAMSSRHIFIHHPTVGAEGNLLSLICVIGDRGPIQTLRFVEFVDDIFPFVLELHLRKHHGNERVDLVPVQEGLQLWQLLSYVRPRVQRQPPIFEGEVLGLAVCQMTSLPEVWHPMLAYDGGCP